MSARDRGRGLSTELVERVFVFAERREQVQLTLTCHRFHEIGHSFIWRYVRSSRKSSGVLKSMCAQLTRTIYEPRPQLVQAFDVPFIPYEQGKPGYNPVLLSTLCETLGTLHNLRSLVLNIDKTSFVAALEEQLSHLPRFIHLQSIAIPHDIQFERFVARQDAVVAVRPLPALGLRQLGRLFGRYLIPVTNKPLQYVCGDPTTVCKAILSVDRLDKPLSEMDGVFSRPMATTCEIHIDSLIQGQPTRTLLWIIAAMMLKNTDIRRCFVHLSAVRLCSLVVQSKPPTPHILTAKVIRLRTCICSTCLSGEGSSLVLRRALSVVYEYFDQLEDIELDSDSGLVRDEVLALELKLLSVLSMLFATFPTLKRIRGPLGKVAIRTVKADTNGDKKDGMILLPERDVRGAGWFPTQPDW